MRVPIEVEDEKNEAMGPDEMETDAVAEKDDAPEAKTDEPDEDAEERARVEAAIRAGEEAAERELAADAGKLREERDELQKRLTDVEDQIEAAKKEAAEATDRMLRLQADWENYRRRASRGEGARRRGPGYQPAARDRRHRARHRARRRDRG